jgi:hypothetical protein
MYIYGKPVQRAKRNIKGYIIGLGASAAILVGAAVPTLAAGNAQSGPTVGDCISDGLYGNEPNVLVGTGGPAEQTPGSQAGNVVPSQSPGPFVNTGPNEPPRNDRTRGSSVGDFNQQFGGGAVPEFCRTVTQ